MKGDPKVLELLNEALKNELTATNQYWLHYRLLDNWGVHKLAQFERSESIGSSPADLMKQIRSDTATLGKVIRAAGIRID